VFSKPPRHFQVIWRHRCSATRFRQKNASPKQIMNHFWKKWRNEYLLKLRHSHCKTTQHSSNRVVLIRDVVIVHDEEEPKGKWRIGKVEALVTGSDGHVRGAVVRVKTKAGRLT